MVLQQPDLLAYGAWRNQKLLRRSAKAQMPRGRFEHTERDKGRKAIGGHVFSLGILHEYCQSISQVFRAA
jgi:hypothetical protein